jgi:UDP-N-acetylglucosamine 2-epimerase (non-hydrolysing)
MSIAIVLGTRPEIIKMAPVICECQRRGHDFFVLHTGQHYSHEMDRVFFEQLELIIYQISSLRQQKFRKETC